MASLFAPVAVMLSGSLVILSSVSKQLFIQQLSWVGVGICVLILFRFVDWGVILNYRGAIISLYVLALALLIFLHVRGPVIRNASSWLVLGPFSFQPVELAKLALILLYAKYFSRRHVSIGRWRYLAASFLFFFLPGVLVALQPNLGSTVILFGLWCGTLFVSGLPWKRVAALLLALVVGAVVVWNFGLKDYHRRRLEGFLNPNQDTLGINYNATQARIAIGSGGFFGKGYGQGSQTQLGFLPVPESDFILAAFTEEWGFLGVCVIFGAFMFLVLRLLAIAAAAERNFGKYICYGAAIMFTVQFLLNTASATGLGPVIGVPAPFLSYGGSGLVINFVILSLVDYVRRSK